MRMLVGGFLIFATVTAWGQLAPQGPQPAYNGQNVSAISLVANPRRDQSPLLAVVTQKPGEPYSQQKINESADALRRAGGFPKVDVNVVPDITGLRVSFLLEPAYYLGVVEFPGVEKYFSYTRLLQVANLSDEDPYDSTQIPLAEKALRDFLIRNGYFQPTVRAQPAIDDSHELVNVSFAVEVGKKARLGTVSMQGPDGAETERLLQATRSLRARLSGGLLKAGKPYSPERIKQATTLMKRTLTRQRRLSASVKENAPQYDPATNRVDISFTVEVGPVVSVRTVGAKLTMLPFLAGRQMRKLIPIFSEGTVDQDLVEEGQRNLTDYFQKKGYYDVKVTPEFQKQADRIDVVYTIDRGKKLKVGQILFHGNNALTAHELMPQAMVKKSHIWTHGSLSQKLLKQSAANMESLYRDKGYEEVKVTSQTVRHEPKIDVEFDIQEGTQTIVNDVTVTGNQKIANAELTAPQGFETRAGKPFSPRKMTEDRNRISATYLNRGYLNAEVKVTATRTPGDTHHVDVAYAITEHQQVTISDVVYRGQKHTKQHLIAETANIKTGAPMRRGQLLEAESHIYDLNIFDWSTVGPRKPITDQTDELALVKVHEAKRNEITYGFGFEVSHRGGSVPTGTVALPGGGGTIGLGGNQIAPSQSTFASPRGSVEFSRRNMRGLAETFSASLLLSRLNQKALTTYTQPHFFGTQWQSVGSFSLERTSENPLYTASLGDLSFQVERLLHHKSNTRLQLRYDFNKTVLSHLLVPDLVLDQDRNVLLSTFSVSLIHDTRDKPLDAHRGLYSTVTFGVTPTVLGSSANFTKLFGQVAYYKPVHAVVFANSVRLGLAAPFAGSFVPTSQLFFSGGGTSLRGFPIDEAGPQRLVPFCNVLQGQSGCVDVTVPVGGKQLFILNSEGRFPLKIMKALGGVVFYDGGNVYSGINVNNFVNNYTNTVGVGLRYATPIGPVRFDLGRNLNPVLGISATQYYITLGQAF
jgi:outer membrane protein insertion porin family